MDNVDCLSVIANHCDVQTALRLAATSKTNWNAFGFNANRENHKGNYKELREDFWESDHLLECELNLCEDVRLIGYLWSIGAFDACFQYAWPSRCENDDTTRYMVLRHALNQTDLVTADIMWEFPSGRFQSNYVRGLLRIIKFGW